MNIYSIPREIQEITQKYYSCFDEDGLMICTQEELDAINAEISEKMNKSNEILEWYLKDRVNTLAQKKSIEDEIERLEALKKSVGKKVEQIDNILEHAVRGVWAGETIVIGTFKVGFRKSVKTIVDDPSKVPPDFLLEVKPVEPAPDKKKIKEAIEAYNNLSAEEKKTATPITWARLESQDNFNVK